MKNPALLKKDPLYGTYGPIGICDLIQTEYGELFSEKDWPALSSSLPESNLAIDERALEDKQLLSGGRKCFKCGSPHHLANSPDCLQFNKGSNSNGSHQIAIMVVEIRMQTIKTLILRNRFTRLMKINR